MTLLFITAFGWVAHKLVKRFPNTMTPMSIHSKDARREELTGESPLVPVGSGTYMTIDEELDLLVAQYNKDND